MISLIIPVYKNSANIQPLLRALTELDQRLQHQLEVVFVVDGSPDDSYLQLEHALPQQPWRAKLGLLSRNFGSFSAVRAGLALGSGEYFAVMAADLQEPPELVEQFVRCMAEGDAEVVVGRRTSRQDPFLSRAAATTYWWLYRKFIQPQMPVGGVDVFGCTREVRDQILRLCEQNSSLVGLLYWVGFRRKEVEYQRRAREIGKSAWTLKKKVRYLSDSIFSFTDLPIRILTMIGLVGLLFTLAWGTLVLIGRAFGSIEVPGYATTVLLVMFFGTLNCFGLGIVGGYVWRAFENSKGRPNYILASARSFSNPGEAEPR
jgi:glycosyltransferase involved in cell wall biosynthesis